MLKSLVLSYGREPPMPVAVGSSPRACAVSHWCGPTPLTRAPLATFAQDGRCSAGRAFASLHIGALAAVAGRACGRHRALGWGSQCALLEELPMMLLCSAAVRNNDHHVRCSQAAGRHLICRLAGARCRARAPAPLREHRGLCARGATRGGRLHRTRCLCCAGCPRASKASEERKEGGWGEGGACPAAGRRVGPSFPGPHRAAERWPSSAAQAAPALPATPCSAATCRAGRNGGQRGSSTWSQS